MRGKRESQQIFFVVLESGADWPHDLDYRGLTDVHIIAQQLDETTPDFSSRIHDRLRRTEHEGGQVVAAAFVLNKRFAYNEVVRRCSIARLLASSLAASEQAELLIRGSAPEPALQEHLLALANALGDESEHAVRVSFDPPPFGPSVTKAQPASGVYPKVEAAPAKRAKSAG